VRLKRRFGRGDASRCLQVSRVGRARRPGRERHGHRADHVVRSLVDDFYLGGLSDSGDAHGDGASRFGVANGGFDERRELQPERHRIGEHAHASNLDVDDAPGKERLEVVERSPSASRRSNDVADI
jgi:hypothetical protein